MSIYSNIIGSGPTFPIRLSQNHGGKTGWYVENGTIDLLRSDLSSYMIYQVGERIRQENFGSRLSECIEEPNTSALVNLVRSFTIASIKPWEPRINPVKYSDIEVIRDSNQSIRVKVSFSLRGDKDIHSLDFSFNL